MSSEHDGQTYLRCEECGDFVVRCEWEAHAKNCEAPHFKPMDYVGPVDDWRLWQIHTEYPDVASEILYLRKVEKAHLKLLDDLKHEGMERDLLT